MLHVPPHSIVPMQRAFGRGECAVKAREGSTALDRLWQEGCAKLRLPRHENGFEAVMINSSGGLTGGDRLDWTFDAGAGTALTVTTQACEKVYAALSGVATVRNTLNIAPGARINWLPQETILYNHAALERCLDADLAQDAQLLACESVLVGREAMAETVSAAIFKDRWRIRRNGSLIHAEQLSFGPDFAQTARRAVLNGARAFASILLISPEAETLAERAAALAGDSGGASYWNGKLLARLVTRDGYALRQRLMPLLSLLNNRAALPKCWSL